MSDKYFLTGIQDLQDFFAENRYKNPVNPEILSKKILVKHVWSSKKARTVPSGFEDKMAGYQAFA